MNSVVRSFEDKPAARGATPLLFGLIGPSGAGKTFSALRIGTGMQRVFGGEIFLIDTEASRSLHYAEMFKFRHVPFSPPFSPIDYKAAIEHCLKKGAKTIIIDSMSHEHEGPGGVLEWHQREVERIMAAWRCNEDKANIPAWNKPKSGRRELINFILQAQCNFVFCFRAKDKIKVGGGQVTQLGFMPIAGEEFVYELTAKSLLLPGANGVPTWSSNNVGEKMMIKLPEQFRGIFTGEASRQLDEAIGERLAQWAIGGSATHSNPPTVEEYQACRDIDSLAALERRRQETWRRVPSDLKTQLKAAAERATASLMPKKTDDYTAQYDDASAVQAIKESGSAVDLEKAWESIALDYRNSGREIPNDVHFTYTTQKETFGAK